MQFAVQEGLTTCCYVIQYNAERNMMKAWLRWSARFYPRAWRERYGEEFDALLEQVDAGWRHVADVLRGALTMQLRTGASYLKLAGALAVVGAFASLAASFAVPQSYVSSAVVRMSPRQLDFLKQQILSRGSLSEMMQRPSLNLYRGERARTPMEDIIQQMRTRDI